MPASWDKWDEEKGFYQGPERCYHFWLILDSPSSGLYILSLLNLVFIYFFHFYNRFDIPQNSSVYLVPALVKQCVLWYIFQSSQLLNTDFSCWQKLILVKLPPAVLLFVCRTGEDWSLVFLTTLGRGVYVYLFLFLFHLAISVPDVLCHKCVIWSHMSLESVYICSRKWRHILISSYFCSKIVILLFSYFQCSFYWRSALCLWNRFFFFFCIRLFSCNYDRFGEIVMLKWPCPQSQCCPFT